MACEKANAWAGRRRLRWEYRKIQSGVRLSDLHGRCSGAGDAAQ